ncbi:MAG: pentapeptide repeat-containing protein [Microcystis aeruginosa G11-01]|nr:pentapeptide repeat-containing protein [Microcystis aeruginosa G11-01]
MMINELKMTEIKTLSWTELERLVNDLKKKHTKKGLTDVETKILKGIFEDKKYADLTEEIGQEEQSIKNAASSLFKILSEQTGEKIGSKNLITALARYRDNSQIFDHNNKPQPQQSDRVLELVIEVGIDDLTPEKIDKINNLIQKIARDNTIKPIMKLKGSIRLFLEGSEDGLQRLADLHQSGELQALLNELKSDDIPEIIVKKAEFTTDAKVIEKAELIKAIREGTIDKTTLQQANLRGAYLDGANLQTANLRLANISEASLQYANLPIHVEAKAMSHSNDSSPNINIGDINNSVVNLGEIIGDVTNTINQIAADASPENAQLKALLQELTQAIEIDSHLDVEEKAEAAKQVKKIAQASQNPDDAGLQKKAQRAVNFLEIIAKALEPASKLAQACQKALPIILGILGF